MPRIRWDDFLIQDQDQDQDQDADKDQGHDNQVAKDEDRYDLF